MRLTFVHAGRIAALGLALSLTMAAGYGATALLRDGTPIKLRLTQTVSAGAAQAGALVSFEVMEDVKAGGEVVIPRGSTATGHVVEARKKHLLHGGSLVVAVDQVVLPDGAKLPLRAFPTFRLDSKGTDISQQIDFSQAAPASLFKAGSEVGKGIRITAYISGDRKVDLARVEQPPPQAAPPVATAPPSQPEPQQTRPQAPQPPVAPPVAPAPGGMAGTGPGLDPKTLDKIRKLKLQAIKSQDPAEKVKIYNKILELNPDDQTANQGLKDAQDELDKQAEQRQAQQQAAAQQKVEREKQEQEERSKQAGLSQALQNARLAFAADKLKEAAAQIAIAKGIAPANPEVQKLDSLIQGQIQTRRRTNLLLYALGTCGVLGALALLLRNRGEKDAFLEVAEGMEAGRRYRLDQEVIHIGAVREDGGNKNDIVITDPDRTISRFHCEIHQRDSRYYVLDSHSANGTFVNGKRVTPGRAARFKKGGRLRLADACTLRLAFEKRKKNSQRS